MLPAVIVVPDSNKIVCPGCLSENVRYCAPAIGYAKLALLTNGRVQPWESDDFDWHDFSDSEEEYKPWVVCMDCSLDLRLPHWKDDDA